MGEINNYKCKSCEAPLVYDPKTGKLLCEFCGNTYDLSEYEPAPAEKTEKQEETSQWGVEEGMKAYTCPSCGAQLICDQTTAATSCPYCGNNTVIPGQFAGALKPEFVIPFEVTRDQAIEALEKHYHGKKLLPDSFKKRNHIEKIQGVYVPFWLYDKQAEGRLCCDCSNSETHREGDYLVSTVRHYSVEREGTMEFQKVPADASSRMPDDYMDSLEPFDYKKLKPFSETYMPGFLADKYDVDKETAEERAGTRCENSMLLAMRDTVTGYDSVTIQQKDISLKDQGCHYALLPVWTLATKWKEKTYLFAVNGQSGKMVGDLPVDQGKLRKIFWSIVLGGGTVLSLLFSGPLGRMLANL